MLGWRMFDPSQADVRRFFCAVHAKAAAGQPMDALETLAITRCFGDHAKELAVSSTKSMIGHPQGACGAAGLVATLLAMDSGFLPPTINYELPDPECDLDYIPNQARAVQAEYALCNCMGFGSKNSALVRAGLCR